MRPCDMYLLNIQQLLKGNGRRRRWTSSSWRCLRTRRTLYAVLLDSTSSISLNGENKHIDSTSYLNAISIVKSFITFHSLSRQQLRHRETASGSVLPAARDLLPSQQPCVVLGSAFGHRDNGEHAHTHRSCTRHSPGLYTAEISRLLR